jgi:hypothetical protein
VRIAPVVALALVGSLIVVVACGGDDSSSGGNSVVPPAQCTAPCTVGTTCFGPVEPSCNGTWYCWTDTAWHCGPMDSGGPPDATLFNDAPPFSDDGPDDTSTPDDAPGTSSDAGPG